jgi:hypothetical protein
MAAHGSLSSFTTVGLKAFAADLGAGAAIEPHKSSSFLADDEDTGFEFRFFVADLGTGAATEPHWLSSVSIAFFVAGGAEAQDIWKYNKFVKTINLICSFQIMRNGLCSKKEEERIDG